MPTLWSTLGSWLSDKRSKPGWGRAEYEISDELSFHLELLVQYLIEQGMSPNEAREAARKRFGDLRKLKTQCRAIYPKRKGQMMDALFQDLRYGARLLLKHRTFTIVAVLSLALGIGINTAMFSFVDAILLKPLDYPNSDRLVRVWETSENGKLSESLPSPPMYIDWRDQNKVFSQMSAISESSYANGGDMNLVIGTGSERVRAARVSANYFDTLGIRPVLGRTFEPDEEKYGANSVAILTNRLWQRLFGSDPAIIGKTISLNDNVYTVIGVLPAKTIFDRTKVDLYQPLIIRPDQMRYTTQFFSVYALLKPGVSVQQASDNMRQLHLSMRAQGRTQLKDTIAWVQPLHDNVINKDLRNTTLLLMGAVLFILLIACVNVANLLVARSASRFREIAIRAALGARRWRLLRQLMAESLLLSALGGMVGLLLSYWLINGMTAIMPRTSLPVEAKINLDYRVLLFTIGLSLVTGLLSGLLPALHATRSDLTRPLQERDLGTSTLFKRNKMRSVLLISEIALCFILVIGAMLMVRSFNALLNVDPGFRPDKILTMKSYLPETRFPHGQQILAYESEMLNRIRQLPGVKSASATTSLPITGNNNGNDFLLLNEVNGNKRGNARVRVVTPEYFTTIGMRVVKGRSLSVLDNAQGLPSVVINQSLAKQIWGDKDPLGAQLVLSGLPEPVYSVVGVMEDTKHNGLSEKSPVEIYISMEQMSDRGYNAFVRALNFAVKTEGDPLKLAAAVQSLAAEIDKAQPVYEIQTMDKVMSNSVAEPRFDTLLFGIFGVLALVLAAVGIYGVMAYSVAQRIKEIGIRMALGAERSDIFKLIISRGLILAIIGIIVGVGGAISLTKYLETLLFEIKTNDPITFVSVAAIMIAVAVLACYVPARRATRIDPMITLRYE